MIDPVIADDIDKMQEALDRMRRTVELFPRDITVPEIIDITKKINSSNPVDIYVGPVLVLEGVTSDQSLKNICLVHCTTKY